MSEKTNILLVEDAFATGLRMERGLQAQGYLVTSAIVHESAGGAAQAAIDHLDNQTHQFDIIITDGLFGEWSRVWEAARNKKHPAHKFIVCSDSETFKPKTHELGLRFIDKKPILEIKDYAQMGLFLHTLITNLS